MLITTPAFSQTDRVSQLAKIIVKLEQRVSKLEKQVATIEATTKLIEIPVSKSNPKEYIIGTWKVKEHRDIPGVGEDDLVFTSDGGIHNFDGERIGTFTFFENNIIIIEGREGTATFEYSFTDTKNKILLTNEYGVTYELIKINN